MKYIKLFQTIADKQAAELDYPNTNYVVENSKASIEKKEPIDQEHIVAKYNITDTSNPTRILGGMMSQISSITYVIVDGVQQPSVTRSFTFSTTGEHTVKYKVANSAETPSYIFQNCSGITSVTIPDSVSVFNLGTFYGCTSLTSVSVKDSGANIELSNNITTIGYSCFCNCSGLTSVTIPDSVTYIGDYAFETCSHLTSITVNATTPPTLKSPTALNNTNNCPIYVPADSVDAYKAATYWSSFASRIQAIQ